MSYAMQTPNQGYSNMPTDAYGRGPYGMITPTQGYYPPTELYGGQHYPPPPPPHPSQGALPPHPQSYLPPPSPIPQGGAGLQGNYPPPHSQHAHPSMQHYQEAMHYGYGASSRAIHQSSAQSALAQHSLQQASSQLASSMISGQQLSAASSYHSQSGPPATSSAAGRLSSKAAAAAQYWAQNCEPNSQSSPNSHCYPPGTSSHKSSPVTPSSSGWPTHPSPHSMALNSPSSTPSPASTPQHHSYSGSSSGGSAQSQLVSAELKAAYGLDSILGSNRSKQNPLLSLQKMVQIEQQQQQQQQQQQAAAAAAAAAAASLIDVQYDAAGNPLPPPPPLTLDPSDPAYPTYYNLDATNFPPTPYSPSIPSKASPEMVRSNSQLGHASVGSCSGSVKHESGSENGDSSQQHQQQQPTCRRSYSTSKTKPEETFMRSGSSETCSNSPPLQSGGTNSVKQLNLSQAGTPSGSVGSNGPGEQMQLTPGSATDMPLPNTEQTRDSSGSYRGSEMTVGSRDSVKSSDSGENAPFSSVDISGYGQLPQSNSGSWKNEPGSGRQSLDDYSQTGTSGGQHQSSQASQQQQQQPNKWWSSIDGSPSSQGNSAQFDAYYSGHQMATHASDWSSGSSGLLPNRQTTQQPTAAVRGPRKYRTKNSIAAAAALAASQSAAAAAAAAAAGSSPSASLGGSQLTPGTIGPDGEIIVLKKKRGRPFGSKNKRSLEAAAAAAATATSSGNSTTVASNSTASGGSLASPLSSVNGSNQNNNNNTSYCEQSKQARKRKPILVDAVTNTSLSFDIPTSYLLNDIDAFLTVNPGVSVNYQESGNTHQEEGCISLLEPQSHYSLKRQQQQDEPEDSQALQQQQYQHSRDSEELSLLQTMASKRRRTGGPVVRVEKCAKNQTTKYSIVNLNRDDEADSKSKNSIIQRVPILTGSRKAPSNGHRKTQNSSQSGHHVNGHDKGSANWICVLCHKGPNHKGLGDLFGPYSIQVDRSKLPSNFDIEWLDGEDHHSGDSHTHQNDSATSATNPATTPTSERRSLRRRPESASSHHEERSSRSSQRDSSDHSSLEVVKNYDVWVHEDCIVWSNSVYIDACTKIRNLEPAIVESFSYICTKCKLPGATLGCLYKNCSITPLHYLCAKEKDCDLDEENFVLSCPKHKKQRMTFVRPTVASSSATVLPSSKAALLPTVSTTAGDKQPKVNSNMNGNCVDTLPELMSVDETEADNAPVPTDESENISANATETKQLASIITPAIASEVPLSPTPVSSDETDSSPLSTQNAAVSNNTVAEDV